ncbi:MAG: DNA recombination protein RmuC [Chitinophagaceae bacterium]
MTVPIIVAFVAAILFTGIIVWFLYRSFAAGKLKMLNDRLQEEIQALARLQLEIKDGHLEKESLISRCTKAESELLFLNDQYTVSKRYQKENELLQGQLAMFKAKFHAAEEKLETHKKEIDTYDKESKERFSLGKEVQRLIETSQQVSLEANNLTTALKGSNKMQGNWGEMILESLLENSGLSKGREYFVQEYIRDNTGNIIKDENGKALQPDVTIYYPDQRKVIIDSKCSLIAWDQFVACSEAESQKKCMQEHARSIRAHIDGLSRKNYPRFASALDYVLLFIPIEPAFFEAVKTDMQLWKYAYDKKILLVSPTNLFAVLRIIADLWKVEQQNRHAIDIADKAGRLYDKFAGFVENLEMVGKKIGEANQAYEAAFRQLSTGNGNIINKVEELKRMGANAQKQLPDRILQDVEEE